MDVEAGLYWNVDLEESNENWLNPMEIKFEGSLFGYLLRYNKFVVIIIDGKALGKREWERLKKIFLEDFKQIADR